MPELQDQGTFKKPEQETILLSWRAQSRPFKRRSRDFYIKLVSVASLFGLVVFLIEGFMPILLMIALLFLFYVMSTIEPGMVEYQITNLGVKVGGHRTDWGFMGRFWFANRLGSHLLVIETGGIPGRMEMIIEKEMKEEIKKVVSEHLVFEQVPPSGLEKVVEWLSKRLPE
ncbi:hypothetical protein A2382_02430 [Candidatus Woesebacteria bacterium RIFOXYB1_FULL_38_16]|uniref:DUF5673 domain-containing protein n=1 Tax=Candidatus Woesebacteria bacterium RIFOXYB1_FULL_38_16 TaxID=1802538 RepID=A0A1F8CTH4_9BACT|nr:MAG: hypothetical protein A2382_02430 [Candidatus Woesebacteria bacterium RIFOXYB1_FULL_38_16]